MRIVVFHGAAPILKSGIMYPNLFSNQNTAIPSCYVLSRLDKLLERSRWIEVLNVQLSSVAFVVVYTHNMDLQFKTNWGPLTGIGVPFLDIKSAVELAVGAYGWWKARERTKSLAQVLGSAGCELSACSTFDINRYRSRYEIYEFIPKWLGEHKLVGFRVLQ